MEIETAIILAIGAWLIGRLEFLCRVHRKHLRLAKRAHPQLYNEIFGPDHE